MHAMGDGAVNAGLNAVAATRQENEGDGVTHILSHLSYISDADIVRFKKLNVIAQSSGHWFMPDAGYETMKKLIGKKRADKSYRFHQLIKSGVIFTLGTDWPASGSLSTLRTLDEIEVAHTRQLLGQASSEVLPPKSERIPLKALIRAATLNGAIQIGQADTTGSIEVGKYADMIVLDHNIFEVKPNYIHKIKVLQTMMNGKVRYESPDF